MCQLNFQPHRSIRWAVMCDIRLAIICILTCLSAIPPFDQFCCPCQYLSCTYLQGLNPGHYIFQFIVKKNSDPIEYYFNTLEVLRVAIKTVEEALPELDYSTPGELFFIQPEGVENVDVMLDLAIAESELYDVLNLCVVVSKVVECTVQCIMTCLSIVHISNIL